jgi:iron(III) transport system substrate-binding protein
VSRIIIIKVISLAAFLFVPTLVWSQSDHTARLIEAAKKEGKLVWYTSMAVAESKPLLDAFAQRYPFVKVELFRATGEALLNRIQTEIRAGRWQFDVVATAGGIDILVQQKLISPYISPESAAYHQELKDRAGYWTAILSNYYVIGYNTELVSRTEAPKDWPDLLDPKWNGKISIDQEEYKWYATLLAAWGKEKTHKFMAALAQQRIQWRKGHSLMAQLMAAKEFPLAVVYAHRIEEIQKKRAPVEWVNTLDPIVVGINGIGLSSKPNNPDAAKLFVDFVLSKEGQEVIRSLGRIPARSDVAPPSPKMDQKKLKLRAVPADAETRYKDYIQEFNRVFGL